MLFVTDWYCLVWYGENILFVNYNVYYPHSHTSQNNSVKGS